MSLTVTEMSPMVLFSEFLVPLLFRTWRQDLETHLVPVTVAESDSCIYQQLDYRSQEVLHLSILLPKAHSAPVTTNRTCPPTVSVDCVVWITTSERTSRTINSSTNWKRCEVVILAGTSLTSSSHGSGPGTGSQGSPVESIISTISTYFE